MKNLNPKSFLMACCLLLSPVATAQVTINVDAMNRGPQVSPLHYGIFYEDINHAADGGLYAELIRNRSFEDDAFYDSGHITAWSKVGNASLSLVNNNLINDVQKYALNFVANNEGDGVRNEGFWGVNAVKGQTLHLSFFAKTLGGDNMPLSASVVSEKGKVLGNVNVVVDDSGVWKKYSAEITLTGSDAKAQFQLIAQKAGSLQLDVVSLFPPTYKDRPNGVRPDLAQMLAEMHPRFMRFPGGCFVEGHGNSNNAFRWKRTIGPIEERVYHSNNWGYPTSNGMGFHEYLQLAEDLGAKPLYVVNVGIWHGGCTPYGQIDEWIEECLDAIEYANGDVNTKYGKMRAEAGHPEPFGLEFIEIGNENYNYFMNDNRDQSDHYPERYIQFYRAIKAKYPYIKCIGNVESWSTDNPSWRNVFPVELVDEHYYRNPQWFAKNFNKYDSYQRGSHKVYVGEYAVTSEFGEIGNLNAAIGEAVFMMGMENNSDVVAMNSYAPIFVNENNAAWRPDMIRFNSSEVMGTPSYYVQKMFANNIGTQVLKTDWTCAPSKPVKEIQKSLPVKVGVATWNTKAQFRNAQLEVDGKKIKVNDFAKWKAMSGEWNMNGDVFSQSAIDAPCVAVIPNNFSKKNHAYSFTVEACKTDGQEGFMVVFDYENANNYCWLNVGGWSNEVVNVEQAIDNGKIALGEGKPYKVANDEWHKVKVMVNGNQIECFIDGKPIANYVKQTTRALTGVYASTTVDDANKMMYVKVVNTEGSKKITTLNLKNCQIDNSEKEAATITTLSSANYKDENTLKHPTNIVPCKGKVVLKGTDGVCFEMKPYSINILKVKMK